MSYILTIKIIIYFINILSIYVFINIYYSRIFKILKDKIYYGLD